MSFNQTKIILIFVLLANTLCFSQNLTLTVTDKENNFIKNLRKEDIKLSLDKKTQEITSLKKVETSFCVGVLFDVSGSMKQDNVLKYSIISQAFETFIRNSSQKNSYFFITFAKDVNLELDTTTNQQKITETLETFSKERKKDVNGTAVYDALNSAYEKLSQCSDRKVIILISDGQDFDSKKSNKSKVDKLAKYQNTTLYTVNLVTETDLGLGLPESLVAMKKLESFPLFERGLQKTLHYIFDTSFYNLSSTGVQDICELSSNTGGRLFLPINLEETKQIFEYLADELNNRYVLTFTQTELKKDRQKVHIEVINQDKKDKYKVRTQKEF
jgi:VWFA-related protein